MAMDERAGEILDFWAQAGMEKWWQKDEAFDAEIRSRFLDLHAQAAAGALDAWADTADGALALVILLDQFTRNLNRETALAWANDRQGLAIARRTIADGLDHEMKDDIRNFIYLPLMHDESLASQRACLRHMKRSFVQGNIDAAQQHLDIIERFGRFPHRNEKLGRETTKAEQAYLDGGGFDG